MVANQLMAVTQCKLFFGSELLSVHECKQIIAAHSNSAKVCQSINGNHAVEIVQLMIGNQFVAAILW